MDIVEYKVGVRVCDCGWRVRQIIRSTRCHLLAAFVDDAIDVSLICIQAEARSSSHQQTHASSKRAHSKGVTNSLQQGH